MIYRNMTNSDFNIALTADNSRVVDAHKILSRDSVYVVCFELETDYKSELAESGIMQRNGIDDCIEHYIAPRIKYIEGLDNMMNAAKTINCCIAVNIRELSTSDYSVLLLNEDKNLLYWFWHDT